MNVILTIVILTYHKGIQAADRAVDIPEFRIITGVYNEGTLYRAGLGLTVDILIPFQARNNPKKH